MCEVMVEARFYTNVACIGTDWFWPCAMIANAAVSPTRQVLKDGFILSDKLEGVSS